MRSGGGSVVTVLELADGAVEGDAHPTRTASSSAAVQRICNIAVLARPVQSKWARRAFTAGLLVLGGSFVMPAVEAAPPGICDGDAGTGGAWPAMNHDLRNTRSQPDEDRIDAAHASSLVPAWSFDGASVGAPGGMGTTPIVAYGCVYLALGQGYLGDRGDVIALDADTGDVVWHQTVDGSVLGLAAANGLLYATPSRGTRGEVAMPVVTEDYVPSGSDAIAFDARTGRIRWRSARLDDGNAANGTAGHRGQRRALRHR